MTMPGGYDSLPLGRFLKVDAVLREPGLSDDDRTVAMLAALCGVGEEEVLALPLDEFARLNIRSAFLLHPPKAPEGRHIPGRYRLGGLVLVPVTDVRKFTAGQYIDYNAFAGKGDAFLPNVIACFLVPDGKAYGEGYDIAEVARAVTDYMPVTEAFALAAFFLRKSRHLQRTMLTSLRVAARMIPDREERRRMRSRVRALEDSLRNGAGFSG